ncbi:MAG TPA: tRNA (adenosine(37)-N6)-threonylcarbamoyltransferase complex ATPase subunit type 1 TsaE [Candidatus Paceibacterota bacterium]
MKIVSKSAKETKNFAKKLAKEALKIHGTVVISLEGDLGAGKTTFTQGFAEGLGIKEKIQSPTFVILKIYDIPKSKKNLIHVDAYRLQTKDFKVLGWKEFIKNPQNIILVEWGNKIKNILPKNTIRIIFKHDTKNSRKITIKE